MTDDGPSRDRFEAALQIKKHDRVPVMEYAIDPVNLEALAGRPLEKESTNPLVGGVTLEERCDIHSRLGFDLAPIFASTLFYGVPGTSEEGAAFKSGGLETRDDLERLGIQRPIEEVVSEAEEAIRLAGERNMGAYAFVIAPFSSVYVGMGMQRFWMKVTEDPDFIADALDKAGRYVAHVMEAICELDLTMIMMGDDVAYNSGLLLHPTQFREMWFGRMEKILAPAIAREIPVVVHNCGNWTDLLPMADELGITGIEPLQPTCNDIYQIKRDWGERFCILGNIDIAGVLAFGTPDEVRADVREHIDGLAGNGGYVVHSSHSIVDSIPHENFLAMVDETRTYGRYA